MIFVSTGTQKFQFNRLLESIDMLVKDGVITDEVFCQIGFSSYKPKNCSYIDFLTQDEFEAKIGRCSMYITHAGVGSIMTAIEHHKKTIVCPRLSRYGEHVDDHQLDICKKFQELGYVVFCEDLTCLPECINLANQMFFEAKKKTDCKMSLIKNIRLFIDEQ